MAAYDEERLGESLSMLPPAPDAWVEAAREIPERSRAVEEIVRRADEDESYRRRVMEDPQAALEEAEVMAHLDTIEILRRRLDK